VSISCLFIFSWTWNLHNSFFLPLTHRSYPRIFFFFSLKARLCLLPSIKSIEAILDSIFKLCIIFPSSYPSNLSHLHFDYEIVEIYFLHLYMSPFKYQHRATHKLCILMFLQFKLYFPYLISTIGFQNIKFETWCINIYWVYVLDRLAKDNSQLKMAEITPTNWTPSKPFSLLFNQIC
jgi:hypothetical protein